MGLFKCLNFQSFPLYLSKRKASVHFHEQMPCLKAVFLQPLYLLIINQQKRFLSYYKSHKTCKLCEASLKHHTCCTLQD